MSNNETVLSQFMIYIHKVYKIGELVHQIKDSRKRRSIKVSTSAYMLIFAFAFRVSSFNEMQFWVEESKSRFGHLFKKGTHLPKIDALRGIVKMMRIEDVQNLFDSVIDRLIENKVLRENTINGLRVAAVDGVEVFKSRVKYCTDCLTRQVGEETEYFHKAVACMTVGCDPHIMLGIEMLKPKKDKSQKDEGEMTAVKRLLSVLHKRHYHFADVIVADALYMNAPFINLVKGIGMDVVIRAKNERLNIVQDALGLFKCRPCDEEFHDTNRRVEVWDEDNFCMVDTPENIRFLKFVEHWNSPKSGKEQKREMWCITTLGKGVSAHTVWLIMRKRWDIENNGFRMLKTYFHADHCYVHGEGADEKILMFIMVAFNLMELFLFRRIKKFREQKMTRTHMIEHMWDELLMDDFAKYYESG